ncbi:hypothetical protein C8Q77DRAFT_563271 [Trametes polyzona]|nr:hypothetical protein C8Q77DRAFT_563271 [Trametes polyzona]
MRSLFFPAVPPGCEYSLRVRCSCGVRSPIGGGSAQAKTRTRTKTRRGARSWTIARKGLSTALQCARLRMRVSHSALAFALLLPLEPQPAPARRCLPSPPACQRRRPPDRCMLLRDHLAVALSLRFALGGIYVWRFRHARRFLNLSPGHLRPCRLLFRTRLLWRPFSTAHDLPLCWIVLSDLESVLLLAQGQACLTARVLACCCDPLKNHAVN